MHGLLEKNQMCFLNVIRFLSCLIVFTGHYAQALINRSLDVAAFRTQKPFIWLLFDLPSLGVMIFFVLSGFLITYSAIFDIKKHGHFSLKLYAEKRCFRIFPPLWFALAITGLIFFTIKGFHLFGAESYVLPGDIYTIRPKAMFPLRECAYNFFLIPGITGGFNGALWSLSYEFFYYILFAVGLLFISSKRFMLAGVLTASIIFIILGFIRIKPDYQIAFTQVMQLFPVWMFGAIIAWLFTAGYLKSISKYVYLTLLIASCVLFFAELNFLLQHIVYKNIGYGIFTSFLVCCILTYDHKPGRISKVLAKGSQYTYTLYLIHFPICLFVLSLVGYRLLNFNAASFIYLYIVVFIITNLLSYYAALIVEDRQLMKDFSLKFLNLIWHMQFKRKLQTWLASD